MAHIFEAHSLPGGLCTAWQREGFTFDGCVHWLLESAPGNPFYALWNELVDMPSLPFVNHALRFDLALPDLRDRHGDDTFHLWADVDRLERYLLDIAPEDAEPVGELIRHIRKLQRLGLPPIISVSISRTPRHLLGTAYVSPGSRATRPLAGRSNRRLGRRRRQAPAAGLGSGRAPKLARLPPAGDRQRLARSSR